MENFVGQRINKVVKRGPLESLILKRFKAEDVLVSSYYWNKRTLESGNSLELKSHLQGYPLNLCLITGE